MVNMESIDKDLLFRFYVKEKKSAAEIGRVLRCSEHKVNYWLEKYVIPKRSISEAVYIKNHPHGDPFSFRMPQSLKDAELFGLGLGLYWGEGSKANKNTVKIGNSDPRLLEKFIEFMDKFFGIKKDKFKFHLHTFSDIKMEEAISFWSRALKIRRSQFYKPMVTITGKLGTYRKKSKYGVLTLHFANTKLRNIIVGLIENIR